VDWIQLTEVSPAAHCEHGSEETILQSSRHLLESSLFSLRTRPWLHIDFPVSAGSNVLIIIRFIMRAFRRPMYGFLNGRRC
jgi:hypothetical protein